jgi:hypothetical protein
LQITIELKGCMMGINPIDGFAVNLSNYRKNTFVIATNALYRVNVQ